LADKELTRGPQSHYKFGYIGESFNGDAGSWQAASAKGVLMARRIIFVVLTAAVSLAIPELAARQVTRAKTLGPYSINGETDSSAATGTVSQVSCAGGLKIQLDTPEGMRAFRRQPGTPFRIAAPTRAQENINPCTSLKGLRVSVEFIPDDEKGMTGTMEQVQILPPEGPANAVLPASQPHKDAPPKGPLMVATTSEGIVKEVRCDGKELRITFAVHDVDFKLHARDYARLEIDEGTALPTRTYDPCTKLSGHQATVTYVLVEKKPYDGEMQAIAVVP